MVKAEKSSMLDSMLDVLRDAGVPDTEIVQRVIRRQVVKPAGPVAVEAPAWPTQSTKPTTGLIFPWPNSHGPYEDGGPGCTRAFVMYGVRFMVTPTGDSGCNTGRNRYRTECLSCGKVLHEGTTGPRCYIGDHLEQVHEVGRDGPWTRRPDLRRPLAGPGTDPEKTLARYRQCVLRILRLFPGNPLPAEDPAHFYIERLESILDRGLLAPVVKP